ncbi:DUF4189 domain-containing protein [Aestuariivirga litoralis]|uniref:DUF4189 domain-containing protein n=1 Tax=Aestuariivirga litoralis TaxID=2650924 RepID=UPI0018C777CB|nr:DUF4189 domain-containing protein [Aestuariivirga litoralis]
MTSLRLSLAALLFVGALMPSQFAFADASKWGAIAIDTKKAEKEPYYGIGGDDTEAAASDTAVAQCKEAGGEECKTIVTYEQCGALAVDGKGNAGWGKAPTKKDAESGALNACKEGDCTIAVSDCTSDE